MTPTNRPDRFPRLTFSGIAPRLFLAGALLASSSCQSVEQFAQRPLSGPNDPATASSSGRVEHAYADDMTLSAVSIDRLSHETEPVEPTPPATETSSAQPQATALDDAEPVRHRPETRRPLEPHRTASAWSPLSHEDSPARPPERAAVPDHSYPVPEYVGDEYIHDGGDRNLPVHYNGHLRMGLDTEDTVAEWVDDEGRQHVRASNRVSVYAPRFGAVRSATLPEQGVAIDRATGHHDEGAVAGLDTRLVLDEQVQADEVKGMLMRSRASGLEAKAVDDGLHQIVKAGRHHKLINLYEDIQFIRDGEFGRIDRAVLGEAIEAALEWSDDIPPVIVAHDQAGQEVEGRVYAQDMTGVEDRRTPGELTITKLADRKVAKPGDVITFTIRFENTGGRELLGVRVVDNLSPRLVYVEESVDSDRNGSLNVEENGAGGQLLTFEFEDSLPGHSGGWVSFQCRVR
jgi:uncharacterized repeat protein (TIGR01451 family)